MADGIRIHERIRIGEQQYIAARRRNRIGEYGGFAAVRREVQQSDAARLAGFDDFTGPIGAAVGRDDDFEPIGRIVECEQVLEARANDGFFVVRRDDD